MSAICPRFTQNAWKKDLCSNCFKSKDEHKNSITSTQKLSSNNINNVEKTDNSQKCNTNSKPLSSSSSLLTLPLTSSPPKGIIVKNYLNRSKKSQSVSFPKELTKIIGYGGEWSDTEISDDEEISTSLTNQNNSNNNINKIDESLSNDDDEEDYQELMRLTKSNTDFNMNNGNLLGDPEENIKKTFAALRLGTPQIDSSGKKQTLKISVTPFGTTTTATTTNSVISKTTANKTNIELNKDEKRKFLKKDEQQQQQTLVVNNSNNNKELLKKSDEEGNVSPPIERAMERSLLDEISETLEKKQQNEAAAIKKIQSDKDGKIKFEITSLSTSSRLSPDLQRCVISRKCNVTTNIKDTNQIKSSKLSIFPKCSDSESNTSDGENNAMSAYYDVIEATSTNGYENIPDGHDQIGKDQTDSSGNKNNDSTNVRICNSSNNKMSVNTTSDDKKNKSIYSSSQYLTDMLLSTKTHSASYSLREGSFMTSKITTDGLIVTKCNSDDALDSSGSSFDGSSDEETSYNMNRSESDSGIGISIGNDYQSTATVITTDKDLKDKKMLNKNVVIGNSDYEDIQIVSENSIQNNKTDKVFAMIEKSRELAGEPDGSADPDGGVEVIPALPKTPPPPIVTDGGRMSFFHSSQKTTSVSNNSKKPEVPAKPSVSIIKTFAKRTPTNVEQQVITQLQQVIKQTPSSNYNSQENLTLTKKDGNDCSKLLKKGRAPNPPPNSPSSPITDDKFNSLISTESVTETKHQQSVIEVKQIDVKSSFVPDMKKDESKSLTTIKSEEQHATIYTRNPSVGIKSSSPVIREKDKRERATINPKFRSLNTFNTNRRSQLIKPSTPEPTPRKNLSMSEECLVDEKKKKSKFSIKKFLRMGTSKTTDNLHKKDNVYSEVVAGDEPGVSGKPRLVIIHPIDINPTAVEVIKDIKATDTAPIVTGKPPAPPQRSSNIDRSLELNKPARPPPPKSAELRRRQKIGFNVNGTGSVKCKSDNVYANLGEIRSAIAPRKPERTASMREREAQLELAKKRQGNENLDTMSICSSNEGNITSNDLSSNTLNSDSSTLNNKEQTQQQQLPKLSVIEISPKEEKNNCSSTYERRKLFENEGKIASKLELFEKGSTISMDNGKYRQSLNDGLKNSVLKINNTIDNYLKDKRDFEALYENSNNTTKTTNVDLKRTYETIMLGNRQPGRSSFPDTASVSGMSCTRSEYGIGRYGINNSFANIPRVVSASYCGSEMSESDIYSPYSFYGSESGGDVTNDIHDSVWGVSTGTKSRVKTTNRLRMRKGRSVVHKNIEDNYSAVVVANHEALAQVLDQLQQSPIIPFALRSLANAVNLRFEDFTIIEGAQAFVVGKRAFHAAIWTTTPVTLALSADCNAISGVSGELNQLSGGISGALNPITEFCDLVPSYHLPLMPSTEVRMLQATISVLPRMQLDTLQSIGTILKNRSQVFDKHISNFRGSIPNLNQGQKETQTQNLALRNVCSVQNLTTLSEECSEKIDDVPANNTPGMPSFDDVMCREVGFIMLQLVNGLKNLQSKAIEEMPLSLSNVILCKEIDNKEAQARLCVLQGMNNDEDEPMGTLCKCAHLALTEMLPSTKLTSLLSEILLQERSESLSKAKSILEFILWGPSDVTLNGSIKERELALQRWLDLERATVLHGLVRTRIELTVYDECHLMFLVRSNAKIMNEAAKIVSNFEKNHNEQIL